MTYTARLELSADGLPRGPVGNPTRSFLLGDPHVPGQAVGCQLHLLDPDAIAPDAHGEVHLELQDDTELGRALPAQCRSGTAA